MTTPSPDSTPTDPPRRRSRPRLPKWLRPDHPLVRDIPMPRQPALHLIFGIMAGIVAGDLISPRFNTGSTEIVALIMLYAIMGNILTLILGLAAFLMFQRDITSGRWHALRADYATGQIIRARFVALGYQQSWLVALWLSQKLMGSLIAVTEYLPLISSYNDLDAGGQMFLRSSLLHTGLQLVLGGPNLVLTLLITAASGFLAAILTTNRWGGFLLTVIIIMIQRQVYSSIDPMMVAIPSWVSGIDYFILTALSWGVLTTYLVWRARRL